jgi:hypothetical protein
MFQDEGRFGLMGRPRRCWAPRHVRPLVGARLQRQFLYAFAAVSPHDGVMDSLVLPWVNAETMSLFLATVAERHAEEFIVMVLDQAGWHIADDLVVPDNMRLVYLPPYSPELNPAEYLNNDVKANAQRAGRARDKGQLADSARGYLRATQHLPSVVKGYFRAKHVKYAA